MAVTIDGNLGVTSPDFEPSSSTVPTNGLFLPTTNTLAWATNSTERLRLDASGNLGIGTSSPSSFSGFHYLSIDGTSGSVLNLRSNGTSQLEINTTTTDNNISGLTALPLVFKTNNSERARIDSSGNLLVGTTSSSGAKLDVSGRARITQGLAYQETVSVANGATYDFLVPIGNGVFSITSTGSAQTTALFSAKLSGGSAGCYQLAQAGGASNYSFGTTAEPAGGTYGRLWYSGTTNKIRFKNVSGVTLPYSLSVIVYGD